MMRKLILTAAIACVAPLPVAAAPGDSIGETVKIVDRVTAEFDKDERALATGDGVNQDELILVSDNGIGEFEFLDKTKLALGSGAQLRLDKYVYDPDKSGGNITIDLVKGAFRFITGVAHKPSYEIKTPTASISVRGTIFDLFIQASGMTWLLLHEGGLNVCNSKGKKCKDLDKPGYLMRVTENGDVGIPVRWAGLPGASGIPFDTAFPFVSSPPQVDPNPVLTKEAILKEEETDKSPARETKPTKKSGGQKKSTKPTKKATTPKRKKKPTKTTKKTLTEEEKEAIKTGVGIAIGIGSALIGKKKGGGHKKPPKKPPGHGGGRKKGSHSGGFSFP